MTTGGPTTVVLVHGAWHGPWCWAKVIDGLTARGVAVVAPELPLAAGLEADAATVAAALDAIAGPVVLCGHSYGGQVISLAAREATNVDRLVYLCAFQLDEGETVAELMALGPNAWEAITVEGDQRLVRPEAARATFYADCDDADVTLALASVRPMPAVASPAPPGPPAWRHRLSTYVVCEQDRAIPPEAQRIMAGHATEVVSWETSHSPFFSRPDLVVDLLAGLAEQPREHVI